ncbi:unnamed protein product [Blumeria hordei]|uniref:Uncharacterized protein n=1 Tax=Blumeria hordei TaxID=2867405 RepID=A0A383UPM1_BLUHO|nr:unnamed protein product [Blumeria hordei]
MLSASYDQSFNDFIPESKGQRVLEELQFLHLFNYIRTGIIRIC